MAMMLVFGCLCVYVLPETIDRNLPNSIEDIEAWTIVVQCDEGRQKDEEAKSEARGNVMRKRKNSEAIEKVIYEGKTFQGTSND